MQSSFSIFHFFSKKSPTLCILGEKVLSNFFLVFLCAILINMIGGIDLYFMQIMNTMFFLTGGYYALRLKKRKAIDILVCIYIVYVFINGLLREYPYHSLFFKNACWGSIFPVFCYFIGRCSFLYPSIVARKMKWSLLFAMIAGIYFYFFPSGWYLEMKESQLAAGTTKEYFETFRLSSFWGHPYTVCYATLIFFVFHIKSMYDKDADNRANKILNCIILLICIITLLLGQLRVTIFGAIIAFFYVHVMKEKTLKSFIVASLVMLALSLLAYKSIASYDSELLEYITERADDPFDEDSLSSRLEHTSGGIEMNSFFGGGYGRYGFMAREHNDFAIVDSEYQKHLAEIGFIGTALMVLIVGFSFLKSLFKKELIPQTCLIGFYIVAMIGASALSNINQYNFFLWFLSGSVWNQNKMNYRNV